MAEYGRFCPVALASEVLADRWTPLIIRELVLGNTRFNAIARGLPGISRSLLVQRLRHLERCGVIETWPSPSGRGSEYHLTPAGEDLEGVVLALGRWAIEWLFDDIRPDELDPYTLTWWMHRRVDAERLPDQRIVIEFRYTAPKATVLWMVIDRGEPSVCVHHPGCDPDVVVTTPTVTLTRVFSGYETWGDALASGAITLDGPPRLVKAVPRWFIGSPFVPDTRRRLQRTSH
jgi:DNA-binding HxlR family transcriptional regulator